jgi:hypothetical protein
MQIVLYLTILMNGLIGEMALRQSDKDRMGIKRDTIVSNTLNLIEVFLDTKM